MPKWTQAEWSLVVTEVDRMTKAMLPFNGASEPVVYREAQKVLPENRRKSSSSFYSKSFLNHIEAIEKQARDYADILLPKDRPAAPSVQAVLSPPPAPVPPKPIPAPAVLTSTEVAVQLAKITEALEALPGMVAQLVRREMLILLGTEAEIEAAKNEPLPDATPQQMRVDIIGYDTHQQEAIKNGVGMAGIGGKFMLRFIAAGVAIHQVRKFAPEVIVVKQGGIVKNLRSRVREAGSNLRVLNPVPNEVVTELVTMVREGYVQRTAH